MDIHLHHGDLPDDIDFGKSVAVDTETMGLNPVRDRLCLVQLSAGDGQCHLVKFDGKNFDAPNLINLMNDPDVTKLFHFARFDVAMIWVYLGVLTRPVYCTKLASRLVRTFSSQHSLRNLCKDLLNVDLSKQQQLTDWGADELTKDQMEYAASDVLYLHKLREHLDTLLEREGRMELAQACFDFIPHRAVLDIAGWPEEDIFAHH